MDYPIIARHIWSALERWHNRRLTRLALLALNDHQLRDIGLDRSEIDLVVEQLESAQVERRPGDAPVILSRSSFYY